MENANLEWIRQNGEKIELSDMRRFLNTYHLIDDTEAYRSKKLIEECMWFFCIISSDVKFDLEEKIRVINGIYGRLRKYKEKKKAQAYLAFKFKTWAEAKYKTPHASMDWEVVKNSKLGDIL